MKKIYLKAFSALMIGASLTSCGDEFLDTKIYNGIDLDSGLNSVDNIGYALNGTYDRLYRYYFAGNYSTLIGDIGSDITYWNNETNHFNSIYQFNYADTDIYLDNIWEYGYKVADNSARIIEAALKLYDGATDAEKADIDLYLAEAYGLRAYAHLAMANVYGHQVMVNGTSFASEPGIVVVDAPKSVTEEITRSTVGDTYTSIVSDLKNSIAKFESLGEDRGDLFYFNLAAAYGLLARTSLYLENYDDAINYADKAIQASGITSLTYTADGYKALFNGGASNSESMFALAIDASNNWSANSCGTLFTTYGYNPSPYLLSLYGENDVRLAVIDKFSPKSSDVVPVYAGGKFSAYGSGNTAYATNYLINAPEMFLIKAESSLKKGNADAARQALLVVAKRNLDITSVNDLPSGNSELMQFIKDERARELFQEGHRLWDLRRWDENANLYAYNWPDITFRFKNVKVSNIVFPIPQAEINTHAGVEQTPDWNKTRPQE